LFDAQEALRLGLVLEVVPDDRLLMRAFELAHSFIGNSPIGLALTKELTWMHLGTSNLRDALTNEMHVQMLCGHTADHHEAVDAFLNKRDATFENR
jgi:enoyl-CoA hydratase